MTDNEFLITTRRRRANAGSRLKQLIDLEEQADEAQQTISRIYTEEDENVNLLFQEDENDREFMEEEEEDSEEDENNENDELDEPNNDEDKDDIDNKRKISTDSNDESDASVNSDEQLSDSDISASDTDMSEGENELQREEKLKKRKLQKKQKLIPVIKKAKIETQEKKTKPKNLRTSEALLTASRRSSSRSSVLENKQALVEKLKESERRRAQSTPIVRIKHQDLTQEEKLAEAVETEKANILSLNEFLEQEVVKKERQRQLLWSKKVKLTDVVRTVTRETFISPLDEVLESRHLQQLLKKAKKRPGRKKKVADKAEFSRLPGELDLELPSVKEELARKKELEESLDEKDSIEQESISENSENTDNIEITKNAENFESTEKEAVSNENAESTENTKSIGNTEVSVPPQQFQSDGIHNDESIDINGFSKSSELKTDEVVDSDNLITTSEEQIGNEKSLDSNGDLKSGDITADEQMAIKPNEFENTQINNKNQIENQPLDNNLNSLKNDDGENDVIQPNDDVINNKDNLIEVKEEEKRVKFVDEIEDEIEDENLKESEGPDSNMSTPVPDVQNDETFEGPSQKVARNNVYLVNFGVDTELNDQNIKKILFGEQSLLPASRRFKDLKTVIRIRKVENPYAVVKYETDSFFSSAMELDEESSIFDELRRLPKFGEIEADIEEIEQNSTEEAAAIILKTEAPTGLYLPNGNKKNCLISGTEVKYFDPNNGIPYSSVETYRFLKSIEQGNVPWYSLSESMNDTGAAEFYLGSRDGSVRHAKGVPDDFDI